MSAKTTLVNFESEIVRAPALALLPRIVFVILSLFCYLMNFRVFFSISVNFANYILIGII